MDHMAVMLQQADIIDECLVTLTKARRDRVGTQPIGGAAHQPQRLDQSAGGDFFARFVLREADSFARRLGCLRRVKPNGDEAEGEADGHERALHYGKVVADR